MQRCSRTKEPSPCLSYFRISTLEGISAIEMLDAKGTPLHIWRISDEDVETEVSDGWGETTVHWTVYHRFDKAGEHCLTFMASEDGEHFAGEDVHVVDLSEDRIESEKELYDISDGIVFLESEFGPLKATCVEAPRIDGKGDFSAMAYTPRYDEGAFYVHGTYSRPIDGGYNDDWAVMLTRPSDYTIMGIRPGMTKSEIASVLKGLPGYLSSYNESDWESDWQRGNNTWKISCRRGYYVTIEFDGEIAVRVTGCYVSAIG